MNTNPNTGTRYGIIACANLDDDVLQTLLYTHGKDLSYEEALKNERDSQEAGFNTALDEAAKFTHAQHLIDQLRAEFAPDLDDFDPTIDEPIIEGTHQGVHYRTTWIGGAQMLWIFSSPHVGGFKECSPCVPGAADLDNPQPGGVIGYDVPCDWRRTE